MSAKQKAYPRRPVYKHAPPSTENDLALMQFLDGGSKEDNIKRLMHEQAKTNGDAGVGDVYRDEAGVVWADREEKLEYAPLLKPSRRHLSDDGEWVDFEATPASGTSSGSSGEGGLRSVATGVDSDLDPRYIVSIAPSVDEVVVPPTPRIVPGPTILAIPTRSRRAAPHLRKPPTYLLDAFVPRSPRSPRSPHSPVSPTTGRTVLKPRPKGKARRIPAPLTIVPPRVAGKCATNSPDVIKMEAAARNAFVLDSFAPAPALVVPVESNSPMERGVVKKKASRMNLGKGFLRVMGGGRKESVSKHSCS